MAKKLNLLLQSYCYRVRLGIEASQLMESYQILVPKVTLHQSKLWFPQTSEFKTRGGMRQGSDLETQKEIGLKINKQRLDLTIL